MECGGKFTPITTTSTQRYCSQKCNSIVTQRRRRETGFYPVRVEITCAQCGVKFSSSPSHALNKSNGSVKQFCSRVCKGLANRGAWSLDRTNQVEYTCAECGKTWHDKPSLRQRKKYCSRACVGMATIRRMATESPTTIEVAAYEALAELGLNFIPQHAIGRALVDAYIPSLNVVIECQGDFHHCNPAIYPDGPRYALQRKTVARDEARRERLRAAGYTLVELWERDIRTSGARPLIEQALAL